MQILFKLLITLTFLASQGMELFLHRQRMKVGMNLPQKGGSAKAVLLILGVIILLIAFFKFWLLTDFFSYQLLLVLIGAAFAGSTLDLLIRSISGLAVEDVRVKVSSLTTILGAQRLTQNPVLGCLALVLGTLTIVISVVGSLWVYWMEPAGEPTSRLWIAGFLFVVPPLMSVPMMIALVWPILSSENLDHDLRNTQLISAFSGLVFSTVYLLFPLWLFEEEIGALFTDDSWRYRLISIPIGLFLVGSVIPHFIGMRKYTAKSKHLRAWRTRYLRDLLRISKLPAGELRNRAVDQKLGELREEIEWRFAGNELFSFYRKMMDDGADVDDGTLPLTLPEPQLETIDLAESAATAARVSEQTTVGAGLGGGLVVETARDAVQDARRRLFGKAALLRPPPGVNESVFKVIRDNQRNLIHWDIRFEHLDKLLRFYEVTSAAKTQEVEPFITATLEDHDRSVAAPRRLIGPAIVGIISGSVPVLLEIFKDQIAAWLQDVAG